MPWFRIVIWLKENKTVHVFRGIRLYDLDIDQVRWEVWEKSEMAFPLSEIMRIDVEILPNDSRTLLRYLREAERQRLDAIKRNRQR